MTQYNPSDRPGRSPHWRRFRHLLAIAAIVAALAAGGAILWLANQGLLTIHLALAVIIGVVGSIMMAALLMGLMFISAHSGRDDDANPHWKDRK